MTSTLRGRLTVWHLSMLAISLGVFAALGYVVMSQNLYHHHDEELERQAEDVIRLLGGVSLTQDAIRQALLGAPISTRLVMVRDRRGTLLYRDPVLDTTEPRIGRQEVLVHAAEMAPEFAAFFTVDLEHATSVRFICVPLSQPGAYLQIGDPMGDIQAVLGRIAWACMPLLPLVLLLSSLGGWLIAGRALAPVHAITGTLKEIQASDLSQRIVVPTADREVLALVATLNQLLDRLQRAFDTLQQFAGDVSHQIQTPLTVLKGAIDSARQAPIRAAEPGWVDTLAQEVDDIRAIVVDLRALALADAPFAESVRVDLGTLTLEAFEIVAALGELKDVEVRCQADPGVMVRGDLTRLKQVVLNLGDNAVKYTPAGGRVHIQLTTAPGWAVLRIADTGIGIPARDLPRLFDRLFRTDSAGKTADGTGLGLAIVKRIVEVHGGTIEVASQPGQGATFVVRLPTSAS